MKQFLLFFSYYIFSFFFFLFVVRLQKKNVNKQNWPNQRKNLLKFFFFFSFEIRGKIFSFIKNNNSQMVLHEINKKTHTIKLQLL